MRTPRLFSRDGRARWALMLSAAWVAGCGGSGGSREEPGIVGAAKTSAAAAAAAPLAAPLAYTELPAKALGTGQTQDRRRYGMRLDAAAFAALREGSLFELTLPDAGRIVVRVQSREELIGRIVVLTGIVDGRTDSLVRLSASGDAVSGSVTLGSQQWQIRSTQEGTTIQNEEAAGITTLPPHPPEKPSSPYKSRMLGDTDAALGGSLKSYATASDQALATLDMMIVGDLSYQALMGSAANELADVGGLVSAANTALANSGAYVRIRLVGYQRSSQDLANFSHDTILDQLLDGSGAFATAWPAQRALGADITVAVTALSASKGSTCGLAPVGQFNSGRYTLAGPTSITLSRGVRAQDRATCSDLTLAHETGHIMGSAHDRANSSSPGAYSFSYGYGIPGVFGDIMSYLSPRLPYFSNPSLRACAGQACGTPTDDAVRTFNSTSPYVANLIDPDSRLSGWYWDPAASGTGWAVEIANGRGFVAAFVYRDDGQPTWVVGNAAPCTSAPASWCVGFDEYAGGQTLTGAYKPSRNVRRVQDAVLSFGSGDRPTLDVQIGGTVRHLQRFEFNAGGLDAKPSYPGNAIPGWYWNPNGSGTGIFVERQKDVIFAAYFYYRADGTPTWSTVAGRNWAQSGNSYQTALLSFSTYAAGQTLTGPFRASVTVNSQEASTYMGVDNGYFYVTNPGGSRVESNWTKFSF